MVITALPLDQAKNALAMLCLPAVTSLQEIISQGSGMLQQIVASQLTVHVDCLATIFRHVKHPKAVADRIQWLWPILKVIFDHRAWDMQTMESLCCACKYAVRTSGKFMGATIGAMLEEIQGLYQQHHQPCFLYLSSEVIKIFGSDPACVAYLRRLIETLFNHTTRLLITIQDFTVRPDVAVECFLLASRCIHYCPHIFIPSSIFPSLFDCAMIGITVQYRDACNSILKFLCDVFDLANSSAGEQYRFTFAQVVHFRGASLTRILIASLTGALPSFQLKKVTLVLAALTRTYGLMVWQWANQSVSLIPPSALIETESSKFLDALNEVALGADISSLIAPIRELSEVCRRNRSVEEIVQGALKPLDLHFTTVSPQ